MPPPTAPPQHQTYILPSSPFRRRQSSTTTPGSPTLSRTYFPFPSSSSSSPITPGTSYSTDPSITSPLSSPISNPHSQQHKPTQRRQSYLNGHTSHISCARCKASLALTSQIISKGFTGRHGRAYLVSPRAEESGAITTTRCTSAATTPGLSTSSARTLPKTTAVVLPPPPPRRRSSALATALAYTFSFGSSSSSSSSPSSCSPTNTTPSRTTSLPNTTLSPPTQRLLVTGLHTVADISCTVCNLTIGWKYLHANEASQKYKEGMYILETGRVVGGVAWEESYQSDDEGEDEDDIHAHADNANGMEKCVREGEQGEENILIAERKGKGKARQFDDVTATATTTTTTRARGESQTKQTITFLAATNNIDAAKLLRRRRQWEHTPVFGMDEEEDDDDHNDHDDNSDKRNDDDDETDESDDETDEDENGEVLFDSQDEDECDDLFAGVWNADVVRERRMSRRGGQWVR